METAGTTICCLHCLIITRRCPSRDYLVDHCQRALRGGKCAWFICLGYFEIPWQQRAFHNILRGLENWGYLLPSCGWCLLCQQHLRHQDLLFVPLPGVGVGWGGDDAERVVALHLLRGEVCVCVNSFYNTCISEPIQKLFLPPFVTSSLPLLLADKMVAAAVVSRNRHCFLNRRWGRLKIISSVAIRNVTRQQRIHSG